MKETLTHKNEVMTAAQQLYNSYATHQSESRINNLIESIQGIPMRTQEDKRSARQFLSDFVLGNYPNEATIKANFVDKVLLKQGPSNITIFELPVGESRVDLCKVNGCSSAYEIKTELDSFYRLEKQISDYSDVFENLYLILPFKKWKELPDYVPQTCGIYTYRQQKDGSYSFKLQRAPEYNRTLIPEKQLAALSKGTIASEYGYDRSLSKKEMITRCVSEQTHDNINRFFKRALKKKYAKRWLFLKDHSQSICKIDYEWFFHNNLDPSIVY